MKKTQRKDALRNIRRKFVSWISIVIVTTMAVGCFLGTRFYAVSVARKATEVYRESNFKDLDILGSIGVTEEDLEAVRAVDGVIDAEGFHLITVNFSYGKETDSLDAIRLTERISVPEVTEGRLPETERECAVTVQLMEKYGVSVGDSVGLSETGRMKRFLRGGSFTVTAVVKHPDYILTRNASVVLLPDAAFDMTDLDGGYLRAIVRVAYPEDTEFFTEAYYESIRPTEEAVRKLMEERALTRTEEVRKRAQEALQEARTTAEQELAKAEKKIADGEKELREQLTEGEEKLDEAAAQITEGEELLADARKQYAAGERELQVKEQEANTELENARQEIAKARQELLDAANTLVEADRELSDGKKKLEDAEAQYRSGAAELSAGAEELNARESEARAQITEARNRIREAMETSEFMSRLIEALESAVPGLNSIQPYVSFKNKARDLYKPVVEAQMKGEDTGDAKAAADAKVKGDIDALLTAGNPFLDAVQATDITGFLYLADVFFGDVSVSDLRDIIGSYFVYNSATPGGLINAMDDYIMHEGGDKTLDDLVTYLIDSGSGSVTIGTLSDAGKEWIAEILSDIGIAFATTPALEDAKREVDEAEQTLERELAPYKAQISEGRARLNSARAELDQGWAEWYKGKQEWDEGKAKYDAGVEEFQAGEAEFAEKEAEAREQLAQAHRDLTNAGIQIEEKTEELEEGKHQLEEGRREYEEGKEEGEAQLADAKRQLEEEREKAYAEIAEAEEQLRDLSGRYLAQNRRSNGAYVTLQSNIGAIHAAAGAFAILFIIVGALVCFTTITIIVDEQKRMIGATRAFGFFAREVFLKYLVYSLMAVFTGIVLGFCLSIAMEALIGKFTGVLYLFGAPPLLFAPVSAVMISLLQIATAVLATWIACRSLLKLQAVQLMSGETGRKKKNRKKKEGGRRGSLYARLIVRNMKTESARVGVSMFIIGCSCGLIGVGFTMNFAFSGMLDKQIQEIEKYDLKVAFPSDMEEETRAKIEDVLARYQTSYITAMEEGTVYRTGDLQEYTYLFVAEEEAFPAFFGLKDADGKDTLPPEEGMLIQIRMAEKEGLKAGDTVTVYDNSLVPKEIRVTGIFENRLGRIMILSPESYRDNFGKEAEENRYLVLLNGADAETVKEKIAALSPDIILTDAETSIATYESVRDTYDLIVYILTFLAIVMSVFVLMNLTNIFVNRKKKELIIMRVNGFSYKQTLGYLLRETLLTTIIGFVVAIIIGGTVARIMIFLIEIPDGMFDRAFQPLAWVIAVLMEAVFAGIINWIAFRKVKKLNLTDATA